MIVVAENFAYCNTNSDPVSQLHVATHEKDERCRRFPPSLCAASIGWFLMARSHGFHRPLAMIATAVLFVSVVLWLEAGWSKSEPPPRNGAPPPSQARSSHTDATTNAPAKLPRDESVLPAAHLPKLLIVGAAGYVGAALHRYFASSGAWNVIGVDRNTRARHFTDVTLGHAKDVTDRTIQSVDAVIYLGGISDRNICDTLGVARTMEENVAQPISFAQRMLPTQLLVFASTAAIAEGYGRQAMSERDSPKQEGFDLHTASMLKREEAFRRWVATSNNVSTKRYKGPKLVGLRFGEVVGASPSQRTESDFVAMVRGAILDRRIAVRRPETWRSYLSLHDQARGIEAVLQTWRRDPARLRGALHIFNLASFSGTVMQAANEVAQATGVPTFVVGQPPGEAKAGGSVNSSRMERVLGFVPLSTPRTVVADLLDNAHQVLIGRELVDPLPPSVPCRVCGSRHLPLVLDLGPQPLATDFQSDAAASLQSERFPLRVVRCRECGHAQLSANVDRGQRFADDSHHANSKTRDAHAAQLARRVSEEVLATPGTRRSVLEVACNDGSQLTHFKKLGWKTYGVESSKVMRRLARLGGHVIVNGQWGVEKESAGLMLPDTVDAIVAHNVLALVPSPVDFVQACVERMHEGTRLYLLTPRCDMFDNGQFDTAHHKHVSFFSARSFRALALRTGLRIVHFERMPIHGGCCFVTLKKNPIARRTQESSSTVPVVADCDASLRRALALDESLGLSTDVFYIQYRARAMATRRWLVETLEGFERRDATVVGYGATPKGLVLLHYLLAAKPNLTFRYVMDDVPRKQNTFCSGTTIPVKGTEELAKHSGSQPPLVIVVFSWSCWDGFLDRLRKVISAGNVNTSSPVTSVWVVLPFPKQQVLAVGITEETETVVLENTYPRVAVLSPLPARREKALLVTHVNDAAVVGSGAELLPHWIQHHAPMFDVVVVVVGSLLSNTARTVRELAPSSWRVESSETLFPNNSNTAPTVSDVLSHVENSYHAGSWWKLTLHVSEFLVHHNLRQMLGEVTNKRTVAISFPSVAASLRGNDTTRPTLARFQSLLLQRTAYATDSNWSVCPRAVHRTTTTRENSQRWLLHTPGKLRTHSTEAFVVQVRTEDESDGRSKIVAELPRRGDLRRQFATTHDELTLRIHDAWYKQFGLGAELWFAELLSNRSD